MTRIGVFIPADDEKGARAIQDSVRDVTLFSCRIIRLRPRRLGPASRGRVAALELKTAQLADYKQGSEATFSAIARGLAALEVLIGEPVCVGCGKRRDKHPDADASAGSCAFPSVAERLGEMAADILDHRTRLDDLEGPAKSVAEPSEEKAPRDRLADPQAKDWFFDEADRDIVEVISVSSGCVATAIHAHDFASYPADFPPGEWPSGVTMFQRRPMTPGEIQAFQRDGTRPGKVAVEPPTPRDIAEDPRPGDRLILALGSTTTRKAVLAVDAQSIDFEVTHAGGLCGPQRLRWTRDAWRSAMRQDPRWRLESATPAEPTDAWLHDHAQLAWNKGGDIDEKLTRIARALYDLGREHAAAAQEGHGLPCYYCGGKCNSLAGNPGRWPIALCHAEEPGVVKWHHTECVSRRLHERDALRERAEKAEVELDGRPSLSRTFEALRPWINEHDPDGDTSLLENATALVAAWQKRGEEIAALKAGRAEDMRRGFEIAKDHFGTGGKLAYELASAKLSAAIGNTEAPREKVPPTEAEMAAELRREGWHVVQWLNERIVAFQGQDTRAIDLADAHAAMRAAKGAR